MNSLPDCVGEGAGGGENAPYARRELTSERLLKSRKLRREPSVAEQVAWRFLRKEQLGFKFRRQHAVGPYVLDFYCAEAMLALEFDGEQHDPAQDAQRDAWFENQGIKTLRIPNREFFCIDQPSRDWVDEIVKICELRTGRKAFSPPQPSPTVAGGGSRRTHGAP